MLLHRTKGIVLRSVKYGDTSIIVSIYTELFGIQSYIVNGIRNDKKNSSNKASAFQPAAILDLVVYHNELKNLHRIKEHKWAYLYSGVYANVIKNTLVLFMIELLQKCLKEPETNPDLYYFIEHSLIDLDNADEAIAGNYALHFALELASYLGFRIHGQYNEATPVLDLQEGTFQTEKPTHGYYLDSYLAQCTSNLLQASTAEALRTIRLNQELRRSLLQAFQAFYALHIHEFGQLRSLPILQEIMS